MEIRVPRPPKESFNKNRAASDLIRKQVEHFRHVESKLSAAQRAALPQGHIRTEQEAADYIAAMTRLLHSRSTPAAQTPPTPIVMPSRAAQPPRGLDIAAAEQPAKTSRAKSAKKGKASRRPRKDGKG